MSVLVIGGNRLLWSPSTDLPNDGQGSIKETMAQPNARGIFEFPKIDMSFARPSAEPLPALKDIDLAITDGEILGRSGSGKSTLLRFAGGLIKPTSGEVRYRGTPLAGPAEGIAVVFRTFAVYPWLTVLDNVELGLDALGLSPEEARRRAMSAIDLVGLDGFQSAFDASCPPRPYSW
jgi:NitT/TauT family transport system ATP-binding protein